ncbi:putative deoxyhypusine synthase [Stylophora pistillata]|uniref:Putative deoxyhypusine synthase n=1 Tax=Stylophora pistillata TaxID=50429 RepID=A0A2B4SI42_STYPI|nr:putative deoxyhypusine synthase [Stylophora pistillata]
MEPTRRLELLAESKFFNHDVNRANRDIRKMNNTSIYAKNTGLIILGGGLTMHHICNANLMRNGADFSVFVNTGQEFDGSDSGARPDEAVSWGKIKMTASPVKVKNNSISHEKKLLTGIKVATL